MTDCIIIHWTLARSSPFHSRHSIHRSFAVRIAIHFNCVSTISQEANNKCKDMISSYPRKHQLVQYGIEEIANLLRDQTNCSA